MPRRARRANHRVRDISVGGKLTLGFTAVAIVTAVLVGVTFGSVERLRDAHATISGPATEISHAADELRFAAAELRAGQQAYVLDGGASRSQFDDASHRFEEALSRLRSEVAEPLEVAIVDKIATGYQTFVLTDALAWDALQRREVDLARNLTLGPEGLAFGFMAEDAARITELAAARGVAADAQFDRVSRDAEWVAAAIGLLAALFVVAGARIMTRLIRDPLQHLQLAAERAARGDLRAYVEVTSADETGRLARSFNAMLDALRSRERALRRDHRRQELVAQVHRSFEIADDEEAVLEVIRRTVPKILDGHPAEVLLADNSKAHLRQAAVVGPDPRGPGCLVESPFSCAAVRNGTSMTFASSEAVDACPHLRGRAGGACSAVCVPVAFMGRAIGVLHATGVDGTVPRPAQVESLTMLATQSGARLGMLRTMQRTQMQAATDGLTGLMNRRTFETRARSLHRGRTPFTLAMADLDHFKMVNDTYGHEAGDRALRLFSEVVNSSLRKSDLIARWGGEEFAFALVGSSTADTRDLLDRIRMELAVRLANGDLGPFTVSFGIVAADGCATFEQAVRLADAALYAAKDAGRDRVVVAELPAGERLRPVPAEGASFRQNVVAAIAQDDDGAEY